jgi:hypothetical protein
LPKTLEESCEAIILTVLGTGVTIADSLLLELSRELLELSSSSTELLDVFSSFFEELDDSSSAELLETFSEELDAGFSSNFAELLDSSSSAAEDDKASDFSSDSTSEESSEHPKNIKAATRLIAA